MIKSMTGYGRENYIDESLSIDLEIKSVNSRYLDISIRMPNQLNFLEDKLRKTIKNYINRGRVDVFIRSAKKNITKSNISVDLDAAMQMKEKLESIIEHTGIESKVSLQDILRNDDVIIYDSSDQDDDTLEEIIIGTLQKSIQALDDMRIKEGANLSEVLLDLLSKIEKNTKRIDSLSDNLVVEYKEKLEQSISSLLDSNIQIDDAKLANEVVFYADRADIHEELSRLRSHFGQFKEALKSKKPIGKKLDFITQEMLRETNTIGSKSNKEEITELVIEQKTIIEKIKEQVQNIE